MKPITFIKKNIRHSIWYDNGSESFEQLLERIQNDPYDMLSVLDRMRAYYSDIYSQKANTAKKMYNNLAKELLLSPVD